MAVAYTLAREGWKDVTVVERGTELGGLAGTFEEAGSFYPLAYHHILKDDRTLLYFLKEIGAIEDVLWRKITMLFRQNGRFFELDRPADFYRFPMSTADKLRFCRLMLRSFRKKDWSDWYGRTAADLVDSWGGPGVREALFEPLTQLKFKLPCSEVSGAWLGARLSFREGSAPFGFIPGANWTKVLCDGLTRALEDLGVKIHTESTVTGLEFEEDRVAAANVGDVRLGADLVVNTVPTEVYCRMAPQEETAGLREIRYSAVVSAICVTRQPLQPEFYWMNLPTLEHNAAGIFRLESLNPTIGRPGDACLNFVTHLSDRSEPFFERSDEELWTGYEEDFRNIFGFDLKPSWRHVTRIPMYSPVFVPEYRNPPMKSTTVPNVYFAGNYMTFPSVASTGTALQSGLETAQAILRDHDQSTAVLDEVQALRIRSFPAAGRG
jgi:protoporphyrinogen oxidase